MKALKRISGGMRNEESFSRSGVCDVNCEWNQENEEMEKVK